MKMTVPEREGILKVIVNDWEEYLFLYDRKPCSLSLF